MVQFFSSLQIKSEVILQHSSFSISFHLEVGVVQPEFYFTHFKLCFKFQKLLKFTKQFWHSLTCIQLSIYLLYFQYNDNYFFLDGILSFSELMLIFLLQYHCNNSKGYETQRYIYQVWLEFAQISWNFITIDEKLGRSPYDHLRKYATHYFTMLQSNFISDNVMSRLI